MNITYTWRNADKTEAVEALTTKKLQKLERHVDKITGVHVIFDMINKQDHQAKATLHVPGSEIQACAENKDMYKAVDDMANKLLRQVDAYKQKHEDHRD